MGTTPIAWNIPKTDTSTLNVNLGGYKPSVGSEVVGSLASIGTMLTMGILSNAIQGKGTDKTPQKQPTGGQSDTIQQQITEQKKTKEGLIAKNGALETMIEDLSAKTDANLIKQKNEAVDTLKKDLFDGDTAQKKMASDITQKTSALKGAQDDLKTKTKTWTSLSSELGNLQTEKSNVQALADSGDAQAKERTKQLDVQINQKTKEIEIAKKAMDDATNNVTTAQNELDKLKTDNTQLFSEVQSKLTTYNKEKAELDEMNSNLKLNTDNLAKARLDKATNESQISFIDGAITGLQNQLMNQKGAQIKQDGTDADNYSKGDASDGNWFSRTFGSKSTRTTQKEAHKEKETAITDYMSSHGCTRKEAEKALEGIEADNKKPKAPAQTVKTVAKTATASNTNTQQTQTSAYGNMLNNLQAQDKAEAFLRDNNGPYDLDKVTDFYKNNPDASNAKVKAYFGIT